jgi:hypothetical protein
VFISCAACVCPRQLIRNDAPLERDADALVGILLEGGSMPWPKAIRSLRHTMLRAFGFPGFAAPIAEGVPPHTLVRTPIANPAVHRTPQPV